MKFIILALVAITSANAFAKTTANSGRTPQSAKPRGGCVMGKVVVDEDGWYLELNDDTNTTIGAIANLKDFKSGETGFFKYRFAAGLNDIGVQNINLTKTDICKNWQD